MYHTIVARRILGAWAHLNRADYPYVLAQLAPHFAHEFVGDHALGGVRHSRAAMAAWFQRLFRLLPGVRFAVTDVLVRGGPWRTRVVALVAVEAPLAGAGHPPYRNEVAQTIDLRWGRITRIRNLEDTQRLAAVLARLGAAGVAEATAPPIED
jgi:ketosteroid isomerase-like protein